MRNQKNKIEFIALLTFLSVTMFALTNGFSARIFAQEEDFYPKLEPLGDVLSEVLKNYVYEPDIDKAVEGAIIGIMRSLDRNSSYIPPAGLQEMKEDTQGEFEGIGVRIQLNQETGDIVIVQPIPGAPAATAGLRTGDLIHEIDGVSAVGMSTEEVARRIKGPRGEIVHIAILRTNVETGEEDVLEFDVKRGTIPLESIVESRMLEGGIGYIRISDFKRNTARDLGKHLREFKKNGLTALVLDLRWNPGGLLTASREVSDLFLPKGILVTSTRGRKKAEGPYTDDMKLYTKRGATVPESMPVIVLVGRTTASSSEIVTGALQFHERALIVGERTFGKGSVQTIIPLRRPKGSALRLTTALYYTPAEVTIDGVGILPDVEVEMDEKLQAGLLRQMEASYIHDYSLKDEQNHGSVTGDAIDDETVEDLVLLRAVEILREDVSFEKLMSKYHKDTKETQVAAAEKEEGEIR